ncbi:hypothetical protein UPYG_G00293770 [Umbra pygmaea]|uniref:Complement C3 n=1 Tax=Umbra pygmaea TaxID=75934 RepID=A0ABD0W584_UMBPY
MEFTMLFGALFLILSFSSLSICQTYVMVAPNILRVGSEESIYLEQSTLDSSSVTITVMDYPHNKIIIYKGEQSFGGNNQALHKLKLDQKYFKSDLKNNQYVYLRARFSGRELEKVVLVTLQSGYVFLQTDKPIYNPGEDVKYRLFVTNIEAKATHGSVSVGLKDADGTLVSQTKAAQAVTGGLLTNTFVIPDIVKEGTWTLQANLLSVPNKVFNVSFDVKKHVLPTFEITFKTNKQYFHVKENKFTVDLEAWYFSGMEVEGFAIVMFGYVNKNGERINFSTSLKRITLQKGKCTATLKDEEIISNIEIKKIDDILGCSLFARATVFTNSGSDIVTSELKGIKVVTSPYEIYFTKSSKYFKPGLPFNLYVYVTDTSGSPVGDVFLESGGQKSLTDRHGVALISINTNGADKDKLVQVKTAVPDLDSSYQARKDITLQAAETKGVKEYLHLSVDQHVVAKDKSITITINFLGEQGQTIFTHDLISYMVISKGRIIEMGKWNLKNKALIKESLRITPDMLPSFRVVAFYLVPSQNDVVSDSVWVDMEDQCMGQLKLSRKDAHRRPTLRPRDNFVLEVQGDVGAKVGLVVVDKAAYMLSNKGKLTQAKIWDEVERSDLGCTRGGGKNNMDIFSDAGLLFVSSHEQTTPRQKFSCDVDTPKRRRRAKSLLEAKSDLAKRYNAEEEKKCCHDGMMDFPLDYSCEKRSQYITDGPKCVEAFLHCCQEIQKDKKLLRSSDLILARTNTGVLEDDDYDSIIIRSKFDVSWEWTTVTMSSSDYIRPMVLQDSITQWLVLGISTSETKGICVAEPLEVTVVKKFYVDLRLPYSVVNREQVQVKVVIHNYTPDDIERVTVELKASEDLCTARNKRGSYKEIVSMDADSQKVLYIPIIPMKPGRHRITVTARNEDYRDGIEKQLFVVPEGVEKIKMQTYILDPLNDNAGKQTGEVVLNLKNMLPGTSNTFLTMEGDMLADTVVNSIGGAVLSALINKPGGCVEQNLVSMTAPIIATHYLDNVNAWEEVGVEKRSKAIEYVFTGYRRHLGFKNNDDTYPPYRRNNEYTTPSTWVTAYTAKVFAMVYEMGNVEDDRVCKPLEFLVKKQKSGGTFQEDARIHSARLTGGTYEEGDVSLAAFVLIAMQETHKICQTRVQDLDRAISTTSDYLLKAISAQSSSYSVAISAYALALSKGNEWKEVVIKELNRASTDNNHWGGNDEKGTEATGYALLALVTLGKMKEAKAVNDWLVAKSRNNGQFGSTQTTIVVFQALSLYQKNSPRPDNDLKVSISVSSSTRTGGSSKFQWNINDKARFRSKSERISQLTDFTYEAEGTGKARLKVLSTYYAMLLKEQSVCKGFQMNHAIEKLNNAAAPPGVFGVYKLTICLRPLEGTDDRMTILDVSLPSGFLPDITNLNQLMTRKDKLISHYELDKDLSNKGSLIIHIYNISPIPNSDYCVPVILFQEFIVSLLQPSSVKVYSYYDSEKSCTDFYTPFKNTTAIDTLCSKEGCACIDKNCPSLKTSVSFKASDRKVEACSGINPVYKVQVKDIQKDESPLTTYTFEIQNIYKPGNDEKVAAGLKRDFYVHRICETSLGIEKDKEYLVINKSKDLILRDDGSYSYVLSGETWLEEFAPEGEQAEFIQTLEEEGCDT